MCVLILHDVTLIVTYTPTPPPLLLAGHVCCRASTGEWLPALLLEIAKLLKSQGRLECSGSRAVLAASSCLSCQTPQASPPSLGLFFVPIDSNNLISAVGQGAGMHKGKKLPRSEPCPSLIPKAAVPQPRVRKGG